MAAAWRRAVDERHQSGGDVDRAIREREGVWLRVAECAKFPRHSLELEITRNERLPDATQVCICSFVGEDEAIALEASVEQIGLLEDLDIDFAKLEFGVDGRRRGFDGRRLLLRARHGSEGSEYDAQAKRYNDQIFRPAEVHCGQKISQRLFRCKCSKYLALFVGLAVVFEPTCHVPALRIVVRPMYDSAFLVPDILAVKAYAVADPDSVDSRGNVDVVCNQDCLS